MSISSEVDAIVALMAEIEALADGPIKTKLADVADHITAIHDDPENANVGVLISKSFGLRAKAIAANLRADLWSLHSDMTEAARARGIDIPSTEGSGGR